MRCAIIADIHGNLAALEAVLYDIQRQGSVAELWCLGDIVGYGPQPSRCIELLRSYEPVCVSGNHDLAVAGKLSLANFNTDAAAVCQWTAGQLNQDDIEYLGSLPEIVEKEDFTLVHGSPREPAREYLLSVSNASLNFEHFRSSFCLVGHTHVQMVLLADGEGKCISAPFLPDVKLVAGKNRMIINPGGVGQPRDGDPRASYAIYDSEAANFSLYRVEYDISITQNMMAKYNMPPRLVGRLSSGT